MPTPSITNPRNNRKTEQEKKGGYKTTGADRKLGIGHGE
jgi:hypothetical protein